jgi:hypothetical protein
MAWTDALLEPEVRYQDQVLSQTWGHLYPKDNNKHDGFILFCHACNGDITPIDYDFKDIDSSPWFYQDLNNFLYDKVVKNGKTLLEQGHVYKFVGTYTKFKNQNCRFSGQVTMIKI